MYSGLGVVGLGPTPVSWSASCAGWISSLVEPSEEAHLQPVIITALIHTVGIAPAILGVAGNQAQLSARQKN